MLHDRGVPGHERRRGEPDDLPEREVPRHDGEDHPERLERDDAPAGVRLDRLVGEIPRGVLGKVLAAEGTFLDFRAGLGDGLPHLAGHERPVAIGTLAEDPRELAHRQSAFAERARAPRSEGVVSLPDRLIYLIRSEGVEAGEDFLSRRINGLNARRRRRHFSL